MDRVTSKGRASNGHVNPGVSVRMGPVDVMDVDEPEHEGPQVNGNASGKRKSRGSLNQIKSYKEASESDQDDDKPLVCDSRAFSPTEYSDTFEEQAAQDVRRREA